MGVALHDILYLGLLVECGQVTPGLQFDQEVGSHQVVYEYHLLLVYGQGYI